MHRQGRSSPGIIRRGGMGVRCCVHELAWRCPIRARAYRQSARGHFSLEFRPIGSERLGFGDEPHDRSSPIVANANRYIRSTKAPGVFSSDIKSQGKLTLVAPDKQRWDLPPPDDVTYWVTPAGVSFRVTGSRQKARERLGPVDCYIEDVGGDALETRAKHSRHAGC